MTSVPENDPVIRVRKPIMPSGVLVTHELINWMKSSTIAELSKLLQEMSEAPAGSVFDWVDDE